MDANTKATTMTNSRILLDVTERLEAEECDPGTPFVPTRTEYIDGDRVRRATVAAWSASRGTEGC